MARLRESGSLRLGSGFLLAAIEGSHPLRARITDGRVIEVDELIIATGFRPDLALLRELRVAHDPSLECPPALAPVIVPNLHSCGTVPPHGAAELAHPEPGFYMVGMKSQAPTFLLAPAMSRSARLSPPLQGIMKPSAGWSLSYRRLASAVAPILGLQRQ